MMVMFLSLKYKLKNFSTYFITWFFPRDNGKIFWKVYVYFRWVDDIVDDPKLSLAYRQDFIKNEKSFLKCIRSSKIKDVSCFAYEKRCIAEAFSLIKESKESPKIWEAIYKFMSTFDFDMERREHRVRLKRFMEYSRTIGYSYAYAFYLIFGLDKYQAKYGKYIYDEFSMSLLELISRLAHYSHLLHIKRDYEKDIMLGLNVLPIEIKSRKLFFSYINMQIGDKWDRYWGLISKVDSFMLKNVIKSYRMRFEKYFAY